MCSSRTRLLFTCATIAGTTSVAHAEWSWLPWSTKKPSHKSGPVYAWGRHFGKHPKKVRHVPDAIAISICDELGSLVTDSGEVHAFTSSGLSHRIPLQSRAVSTAIRSDPEEVVILDDSGSVYKCRKTSNGFDAPTQLKAALRRARIVNVSCGKSHCVAVSDYGQAFAWGSNNSFGQLCNGHIGESESETTETPTIITTPPNARIVQASCGDKHTMLLDDNGIVYSGGEDKWTQLGKEAEPWVSGKCSPDGTLSKAELISDLPVSEVACGNQHTTVLVRDGTIFSFGYNLYGQLGHHNYTTFAPPSPIANITMRASTISAGGNSTCIIGRDGELRCIGAVGSLKPNMKWRRIYEVKENGGKRVLHAISVALGGDSCAIIADELERE